MTTENEVWNSFWLFLAIGIIAITLIALFNITRWDEGDKYNSCIRPCNNRDFVGTYNLQCVRVCQDAIWLNKSSSGDATNG